MNRTQAWLATVAGYAIILAAGALTWAGPRGPALPRAIALAAGVLAAGLGMIELRRLRRAEPGEA